MNVFAPWGRRSSASRERRKVRVIFESPPVPATFTDPRDGSTVSGNGGFQLILHEPGEDPAPPTIRTALRVQGFSTPTHTLSELRSRAGVGHPIEIPPPAGWRGPGVVVIPEAVLTSLPESAHLTLRWQFTPAGQS